MSENVLDNISSKLTTNCSTIEENEISAQITSQVTMALSALDSRYKENVATYAQELYESTHKIETVCINLDLVKKEKEPYNSSLDLVKKEIDYEVRMLEHFTEQWVQKTVVMVELESELKQLEHTQKSDYMFQSRREELKKLQLEIENSELSLLNHELERENILLKIEPINYEIDRLEKNIRELESQKKYIETSYLHRITQVAPAQQQQLASPE